MRRAAGFTLIELLVVVALFGLVSVMLLGSFRFATRAVTGGTQLIDRAAELELAADVLRRTLGDAQALPLRAGSDAPFFEGTRDSVAFIGLPPAYLAAGGWHRLTLGVERSAGRPALTLRWQLLAGPTATERPSLLLGGLGHVDFAYFGTPQAATAPDWHDRWNGRDGLPSLVRLRLTRADGGYIPDLIVAVRPASS